MSALVGVLISITTIPAAANVGVATTFGERGEAGGAAAQLGVNPTAVVLAGVATLHLRRRSYVARRARHLCDPIRRPAGLTIGCSRRSQRSAAAPRARGAAGGEP